MSKYQTQRNRSSWDGRKDERLIIVTSRVFEKIGCSLSCLPGLFIPLIYRTQALSGSLPKLVNRRFRTMARWALHGLLTADGQSCHPE